jgi:Magnesium transporter NIPA
MVATFVVVIGTLILARFLRYWSDRVHESHSHPKHERSPSASRSKSRRRSLSLGLPRAVQLRASRLRVLRGLAYALISGILSAHSLLVAKSAVELLVRTIIDHVNQFHSYQSWLILLALVSFALSQLYYLHQGLRLCSTSVLYPFVFCIYNIIAILDGLIYFHQTSRLSILHACLIALGTVILLSGVLALSWRLDDALSAEPQSTPLGPGLGLVSSTSEDPSDSSKSPLLPTARPRSPTSRRSSSRHVNESTPLLSHRQSSGRRTTFMIYPPPPETGSPQHIWAELDDSNESDADVLASLPRSISPFLSASPLRSRRRTRGSSLSSANNADNSAAANGLWGRPPGGGGSGTNKQTGSNSESPKLHHKPPRRSQTLKERTHGERRRSSAPTTADLSGSRSRSSSSATSKSRSPVISSEPNLVGGARMGSPVQRYGRGYRDRVRGRPRSATEAPRVVPSRWDMSSVARWWQGQGEDQDRRDQNGRGGEDGDGGTGAGAGAGAGDREEGDRRNSGG